MGLSKMIDINEYGKSFTLGELIKYLEQKLNKEFFYDSVVPLGFNNPHSWRGRYECLAFEPAINMKIGAMLDDATSSLGRTFEGYKGGLFTMDDYTEVYLAWYGSGDGEIIGRTMLDFMCGVIK